MKLCIGQSFIFIAHRKVLTSTSVKRTGGKDKGFTVREPAIFSAFVVNGLEHICIESELALVERVLKDESLLEMLGPSIKRVKQLINLQKQGVKLVAVPDDDQDHR